MSFLGNKKRQLVEIFKKIRNGDYTLLVFSENRNLAILKSKMAFFNWA